MDWRQASQGTRRRFLAVAACLSVAAVQAWTVESMRIVVSADMGSQANQILKQGLEPSETGPQAMALSLQRGRKYYGAHTERVQLKLN